MIIEDTDKGWHVEFEIVDSLALKDFLEFWGGYVYERERNK